MKEQAVNFFLQGKGGVGKSFGSVLAAQYIEHLGRKPICADTDPVNATFTQYQGLDVAHIEITEGGKVIQSKFDPLMELILQTGGDFVVDNGAATFLPLSQYLAANEIYGLMAEAGKNVYVHSVLTAGQAKADTFNGFSQLLDRVDERAKVIVWLNEYWGEVEFDGHPVQSTKVFKQNAHKIAGVVRIADRSRDDEFVAATKKMTEMHLALREVMNSEEFSFLEKARLKKIVGEVFSELDEVNW